MSVEFVRDLNGFRGDACLVRKGDAYFVVSSAYVIHSGFETLVFPANESGEVLEWLETAGGRGMSRSQAIADLERR
jgi:hypothetical protein